MRFNLLGGPGLGKSTKAAWLYSQLKMQHHSVELVGEYVKTRAIQKIEIKKYDQFYIFGKQQHYEYRYLSHGIKNIVTDSPTFLASIYSEFYQGSKYAKPLEMMDDLYEEDYPSYNIFIDRRDMPYQDEGRYEDESTACEIDEAIMKKLKRKKRDYDVFKWNDLPSVLDEVLKRVDVPAEKEDE
jgi:hypothetical protein